MPIEIKKIDSNINKSNYEEKIIKFEPQFVDEVKNMKEANTLDWKTMDEKMTDFKWFVFYVLTPVYEDYIEQKFSFKRWVDLSSASITPDDKFIFPDGIKSWLNYFNEFIKLYKQGKINISSDYLSWGRDFDKYMQIFYKLSDKSKVAIFKEVYYSTYYFDAFNRHMRCTADLLKKLRKDIKK